MSHIANLNIYVPDKLEKCIYSHLNKKEQIYQLQQQLFYKHNEKQDWYGQKVRECLDSGDSVANVKIDLRTSNQTHSF